MNNVKELEFVSLVRDTTFKYLFKNEDTRKWLEEIVYDKFNIDLSDLDLRRVLRSYDVLVGEKVRA